MDDPAPQDPPANDPPQDGPAPAARPEGIPDDLWGDNGFNADAFASYRAPATDLPADASGYELPKVGEAEIPEGLANSPFMSTLREAAFSQGVGQEGFNNLVTQWVEADTKAADDYVAEQKGLIGQNFEARETAVSTWLDGSLPKEQAEALRGAATSAAVFHALEQLMNKGAAPPAPRTDDVPPPNADTIETIRSLMASKEYSGDRNQRDPAVIARVDKFWEDQAKKEAK